MSLGKGSGSWRSQRKRGQRNARRNNEEAAKRQKSATAEALLADPAEMSPAAAPAAPAPAQKPPPPPRSTIFDAIKQLDTTPQTVKGRGPVYVFGSPRSVDVLQLCLLLGGKGVPYTRQLSASSREGDEDNDFPGSGGDIETYGGNEDDADAALATAEAMGAGLSVSGTLLDTPVLKHGDVSFFCTTLAMQYIETAILPGRSLMGNADRRAAKKRWEAISLVMSKTLRLRTTGQLGCGAGAMKTAKTTAKAKAMGMKSKKDEKEDEEEEKGRQKAAGKLETALNLGALEKILSKADSSSEKGSSGSGGGSGGSSKKSSDGSFLSGPSPGLLDFAFYPLIAEGLGRGVTPQGKPLLKAVGPSLTAWVDRMTTNRVVATSLERLRDE